MPGGCELSQLLLECRMTGQKRLDARRRGCNGVRIVNGLDLIGRCTGGEGNGGQQNEPQTGDLHSEHLLKHRNYPCLSFFGLIEPGQGKRN
jgi:hypothetical protein